MSQVPSAAAHSTQALPGWARSNRIRRFRRCPVRRCRTLRSTPTLSTVPGFPPGRFARPAASGRDPRLCCWACRRRTRRTRWARPVAGKSEQRSRGGFSPSQRFREAGTGCSGTPARCRAAPRADRASARRRRGTALQPVKSWVDWSNLPPGV